ncbi:iron-sulfur cluster assembly 2 homolog, mitochondrial isoform X2 [Drosophila takahashii]|uniref:iron-sulfur cluster assembly 2 homolog, mitochondrial isoform X2 n=1 Tax=Drosophila takahashii TaxID=29030 RepID=UPI00389932C0
MAFLLRQVVRTGLQSLLPMRYASVSASANPELSVQVSESCLKRLREICVDGSFLRVTVEGGGCSGFQYKFDLDKQLNEDDRQFGDGAAKVVIDTVSLEYCSGATVDYHSELIRAGFRMVANPLAEQGCSCGSSFSIKL